MKFRRLVALIVSLLILASAVGINLTAITAVADDIPPSFSADKHVSYEITGYGNGVFSEETLTVADATNSFFETKLSEDASYYMSLDVIASGTYVNIGYRAGDGYIQLQSVGYNSVGTGSGWTNKSIPSLKTTGSHVVLYSTPTSVTVWVDDEKIVENELTSSVAGKAARPGITWNLGTATVKNILIWSEKSVDEPIFDSKIHKKYDITGYGNASYSSGVVTVGNESNSFFETQLGKSENYYMSLDAFASGTYVNIGYRTGNCYLQLQSAGYYSVGTGSGWKEKQIPTLKTTGTHLTLYSTPEEIRIWVDGELLVDSKLIDSCKNKDARPGVTWNIGGATVKNIVIWTESSSETEQDEEPVFDKSIDTEHKVSAYDGGSYLNDVLTVSSESSSKFKTNLNDNDSYYMSLDVVIDGTYVNIGYRAGDGYIQLQSAGYYSVGTGSGWKEKQIPTLKTTGTHVTVYSTPTHIKIWIDGNKTVDSEVVASVKNQSANCGIVWCLGNAQVKNVLIWTNGISDEPVFNEESDYLYSVNDCTVGLFDSGVLKIPSLNKSEFITDLPFNADYYMTLKVKTDGNMNVGFRTGDGYINFNKNGYNCVATTSGWQNKQFNSLSSGMRVTLFSSKNHLSVWADGEKIVDSAYTKGGNTLPGISWTFDNEVEVSGIVIWTNEIFKTDEPKYDEKVDSKINVEGCYNAGIADNGYLVPPLTDSRFIADLSFNADYYMSMTVKTEDSVNIGYRSPDGVFNMNKSGYRSVGTDGVWQNKNFSLLPYGVRVTLHSSQDHISIWVNGEKIIDEPYLKEGETYPAIAWSFSNDVTVTDISLWQEKGNGDKEYLGEIEKTKIPEKKQKKVIIPKDDNRSDVLKDNSVVGKEYVKPKSDVDFGSMESVPVESKEVKNNSLLIYSSIAAVAVLLTGLAALIIFRKKKF